MAGHRDRNSGPGGELHGSFAVFLHRQGFVEDPAGSPGRIPMADAPAWAEGGDEKRPAPGHFRDELRALMQKSTVLNRMNTCLHCSADPVLPVRVCGDPFAELGSLFHRDPDLLGIEMSSARYPILDQDRACNTQLDQVSSMLHLFAYRFSHFLHTIRDPVHALIIISARFGDRDKATGQHHTWSIEFAAHDRTPHGKLEFIPASEIADCGDARRQVFARIPQDLESHQTVIYFELAIRLPTSRKMNIAVDQSGQQEFSRVIQVDNILFVRGLPLLGFSGIDDPAVTHGDGCVLERLDSCSLRQSNFLKCDQRAHTLQYTVDGENSQAGGHKKEVVTLKNEKRGRRSIPYS